MKAIDLMTALIGEENINGKTVDTCKAGDPERELKKVATCLTPTADVLREASEWGADLIITHEPTYYQHMDFIGNDRITALKHDLVQKTGITIWRFHDWMHFCRPDLISLGFIEHMGLKGEFDGEMHFILDKPVNPVDFAREIEAKCGLKHVRIAGARDGMITKIGLFLGHRGDDSYEPFKNSDEELAVCGELCEWANCEPIRDAAQFGLQKTLLVLGHAASELWGMKMLADRINSEYAEIEAKYIDCGEIYSYTDL